MIRIGLNHVSRACCSQWHSQWPCVDCCNVWWHTANFNCFELFQIHFKLRWAIFSFIFQHDVALARWIALYISGSIWVKSKVPSLWPFASLVQRPFLHCHVFFLWLISTSLSYHRSWHASMWACRVRMINFLPLTLRCSKKAQPQSLKMHDFDSLLQLSCCTVQLSSSTLHQFFQSDIAHSHFLNGLPCSGFLSRSA